MYLLDTDTLIYFLKGEPDVVESVRRNAESPMALSVVTYGELIYGAVKSRHRTQNLAKVLRIAEIYPVVEVSRGVMDLFGPLKADLREEGDTARRLRSPYRLDRAPLGLPPRHEQQAPLPPHPRARYRKLVEALGARRSWFVALPASRPDEIIARRGAAALRSSRRRARVDCLPPTLRCRACAIGRTTQIMSTGRLRLGPTEVPWELGEAQPSRTNGIS